MEERWRPVGLVLKPELLKEKAGKHNVLMILDKIQTHK
jgi:hypothetical protein